MTQKPQQNVKFSKFYNSLKNGWKILQNMYHTKVENV